jgi:hypothetical protein
MFTKSGFYFDLEEGAAARNPPPPLWMRPMFNSSRRTKNGENSQNVS